MQLKQSVKMERVSMNIERGQEFHIACMIFVEDSSFLIHEDPDRGLELNRRQNPVCIMEHGKRNEM